LEYEQFFARLNEAGVTAVADVRSSPYSRNLPHFNREALKEKLAIDHIQYVFLGKELGGRPNNKENYTDGIADYEKMANTEIFKNGIKRILSGALKYRIAMMCSEHNPLDCHRCLLVGRALEKRGVSVKHILQNGEIVTQDSIEQQLLIMADKQHDDMFASPDELLNEAYRLRARKVAFAEATLLSDTVTVE